jgi:hypothetical protein
MIFPFKITKIYHNKNHDYNKDKVNLKFPDSNRDIFIIEFLKLRENHRLKTPNNGVISELSLNKIK